MKTNIKKSLIFKTLPAAMTLWLVFSSGTTYAADTLTIAAASNLTYVMPSLVEAFEASNKDLKVRASLSSTGNLYSQIRNGAPFDLFLAADEERPKRLFAEGFTEGEPFTYAIGGLVLWSREKLNVVEGLYLLSSPEIKRIALANPDHAPYGAATREALIDAGLWSVLKDKFIYGENVGQAAQFVQSGAAQAGFMAESLLKNPAMEGGSFYRLPAGSHTPLVQRGVVLKRKGRFNSAALRFRDFLFSPAAKKILKAYGYGVD